MAEVTKPILLDETGQAIVGKLQGIIDKFDAGATKAYVDSKVAAEKARAQAAEATKIGDAPSDSKQYVRKDAAWEEVNTEGTVHYDEEQTLEDEEKAQARENIGAQETLVAGTNIIIDTDGKTISAEGGLDSEEVAPGASVPEFPFVEYVPQTLTTEQKRQVRVNIGALDGTLVQFPTRDDFPDAGNPTAIYLDQQTGATYRWDTATLTYKNMGSNQNPVPGPDTANGVYIKYTDGSISDYNVLIPGKTPVGPALINGNIRLVLHPDAASLPWGANGVALSEITSSSGKYNTDKAFDYMSQGGVDLPSHRWARNGAIYADGSEGWFPSITEMSLFISNRGKVNTSLSLMGGILLFNLLTTIGVSNFGDSNSTWYFDSTGLLSSAGYSKAASREVRSITSF